MNSGPVAEQRHLSASTGMPEAKPDEHDWTPSAETKARISCAPDGLSLQVAEPMRAISGSAMIVAIRYCQNVMPVDAFMPIGQGQIALQHVGPRECEARREHEQRPHSGVRRRGGKLVIVDPFRHQFPQGVRIGRRRAQLERTLRGVTLLFHPDSNRRLGNRTQIC